ncbi:hypothetical protein [Flavobacterium humi]|uniref:O-antigen ligase domain-containing protein n=1 Tax=Flavobacterium humi TaxID=2562683 RepID=A0A4Z0L5A6_9FLAO|nr:hypothetical protein [Flavobacterium humi]TGD57138.1 hypothetical protein E4635_13295 [Flavobacterium humi]
MTSENTFISKVKCIVLALLPVLGMYHYLAGISLGLFILLLFVPIDFIFGKGQWKMNWNIIGLVSVFIIVNIFSYHINYKHIQYQAFINNLLYLLFFMLISSYYTSKEINVAFFEKVLLFLGVAFSIIVLIQAFNFLIRHESISFLLPLETDLEENVDSIQFNGRPNSVFQEPAHFAIFMIPLLYNVLSKKKVWLTVLFTVSIFLSTSTYGLMLTLIIYLIYALRNKNGKIYFFLILIFCALLFFFFYDFFQAVLDTNINKTQESMDLTGNTRFMGGIESVEFMDFFQHLLGIGYNQTKDFMEWHYLAGASNYSNSFLFSFYAGGLVGFLALLYFLKKTYKINIDKIYFLIFFLTLLTDQIIFNQNFLYLLFVIYFIKPNYNENSPSDK